MKNDLIASCSQGAGLNIFRLNSFIFLIKEYKKNQPLGKAEKFPLNCEIGQVLLKLDDNPYKT